jgi:hypothetical protein
MPPLLLRTKQQQEQQRMVHLPLRMVWQIPLPSSKLMVLMHQQGAKLLLLLLVPLRTSHLPCWLA